MCPESLILRSIVFDFRIVHTSSFREIHFHMDRDLPEAFWNHVVRLAGLESQSGVHRHRFVHIGGRLQSHDDITRLYRRENQCFRQLSANLLSAKF